jgi:hypothetical protein
MTKAEQFREYAEEAMQWSRQSKTEDARKVLIDLAFTWTQAASWSERRFARPPELSLTRPPKPNAKFEVI